MIHGGNVWQGASPESWLDYSANIRPEGAPDWVKSALMDAMDNISYYPDPDMRRGKRALADYLGLPEGCALPTAGGISAIDLATHLESTGMLQFTPCFAEYSMLGANRGLRAESVPILTGKHAIGDPARQAEKAMGEGRMVWLCNPLNPIGCAFSVEQIERLIELVEKKRGWLVMDEAFIEYCPERSATGLIGKHERLLITGSMTKILGIPGVRLGYLCAQPQTLARVEKYQLTWEISCFAEAVLRALPEHADDVRAYGEINARRRAGLRRGLEEMGIYVYPSEAAFVLADMGRPVGKLAEKLKARGILVRECLNFEGVDDGRHLRLAVKDEASNEKLIEAIREEMICAANL